MEQRLEEEDLARKNKEVELAKESARAKEIEISNLKLQKEQQELACDLQHVKQELEERERRMGFLSEEKHSVEHALSQASVDARLIADLKVCFHFENDSYFTHGYMGSMSHPESGIKVFCPISIFRPNK